MQLSMDQLPRQLSSLIRKILHWNKKDWIQDNQKGKMQTDIIPKFCRYTNLVFIKKCFSLILKPMRKATI